MVELEIKKFIDELESRVKPLRREAGLAYWNASISGKKEDFDIYTSLSEKVSKIFNEKDGFEKIKKFKETKINDDLLRRQIDIVYNSYLGGQGDINLISKILKKVSEIEHKFNIFRANVDGKEISDNDIKNLLRTELDSDKLRIAWEASKKQGGLVAKDVIEVVKLRNERAKQIGFDNYYQMSMELGEQKVEEVAKIFDELAKDSEGAFRNLKNEIDEILSKRYNISKNDLKPWHYHDLFFQEGPRIYDLDIDEIYKNGFLEQVKNFYKGIDLDADDVLNRGDLYEKKGKNQHAYCIDIDRDGDIRILQNVKNDSKWGETTLHELGHGVYQKFIDKKLPYFLRDNAHTLSTEAIAQLFGRQANNINFLKSLRNIGKEEEMRIKEDAVNVLRLRQVVFARWCLVMMNFERGLYENPDQDLNKLWYSLVSKYQLLNFQRDKPDWASKIHLISSPVYYHNYALGEMYASQIHAYICKNILKINMVRNVNYFGTKEIGNYLKDRIFSLGMKYKWDELAERSTGEKLNPKYFVKEFII